MANPSRKEAQDTAKKKRTSTRKTKNPEATTPKSTTPKSDTPKSTSGRGRGRPPKSGGTGVTGGGTGGGISPTGGGKGGITPEGLSGGMQVLDINSLSSSDPYAPLPNIPEMSKKESLAAQTSLAKQQNALDVRLEHAKTVRKGIKVATEEQNAVTDAVNFHTAVVGTETAVWNYQSATAERDIAASKYEQKTEQLIQQQNATATTIALTPLLQEENDLTLTKQQLKNDKLRLDIEQTRNDLAMKQNELDAMVIDI